MAHGPLVFKLPQPFDRGVSQYKVTVQRVAASLQSCHSLLRRFYEPTTVYELTTKCCGIYTKLPQGVAAFLQSCHSVMPHFYEAATASCRVSTKVPQRVAAFLQSCHCMLRRFHGCIYIVFLLIVSYNSCADNESKR